MMSEVKAFPFQGRWQPIGTTGGLTDELFIFGGSQSKYEKFFGGVKMKKMKQSALAAAVLLSVATMTSAYAKDITENTTLDITQITENVNVQKGAVLTLTDITGIGVLNYAITGTGKTVVDCNIQAPNGINTALNLNSNSELNMGGDDCRDIVINGTVSANDNTDVKFNFKALDEVSISNISMDESVNAKGLIDAAEVNIASSSDYGILLWQSDNRDIELGINQSEHFNDGKVTISAQSRWAARIVGEETTFSVDGSEITFYAKTERAIEVSAGSVTNIGQNNPHGNVTIEAGNGTIVMFDDKTVLKIDGDVVKIKGGNDVSIQKGACLVIGGKNQFGDVSIQNHVYVGDYDTGNNVCDGTSQFIVDGANVDLLGGIEAYPKIATKKGKSNIDARVYIGKNNPEANVKISGSGKAVYAHDKLNEKLWSEIHINGSDIDISATTNTSGVTDAAVVAQGGGLVFINSENPTPGKVKIKSPDGAIKVINGTYASDVYLYGSEIFLAGGITVEENCGLLLAGTMVNNYKYDGITAGTVNNTGNMTLDGNGGTMTFSSGAISGAGTINIKGNVKMHVSGNIENTVNVKDNATLDVDSNIQFATLNFENGSTLIMDETNPQVITVTTDASVGETSKLVLKNAETGDYTILSGVDDGWSVENISANALYDVSVETDIDSKFVVTLSEKTAEEIPADGAGIIAGADKNTPVGKWVNDMAEANVGNDDAVYNAINTVANMSAVAGVQSGTASMVNSMANNLASNRGSSARPNMIADRGGLRNTAADNGEVKIDTVEVGKAADVMPERYLAKAYNKEVWASYIHSKQHVDGLKAGMLDSKSVNQYNGVTVGADLWSGKHSFGGVALSYADGNVNAGNLRNDTDYYGVSIYNRHDYKGLTMLTDVSYTHSKNDINISGTQEITADAKADAVGVGVRFETPVTMGKTTVTPYAGARYTYLKNKDYDNNLGMNYDTDNQNLVTIPVGLEISAEFAMPKSDWTFRPVLEGGYVWNLGDRDGSTKIGYMGAYDIVGFETSDPGQYFIRAAMQFAKADFTCEVGYRYSKGKSVRDNRWNVNLNYIF